MYIENFYFNIYFSYFKCKSNYCQETLTMKSDGSLMPGKEHNHEPCDNNYNELQRKKQFKEVLYQRAKDESTTLKNIYDEESIK